MDEATTRIGSTITLAELKHWASSCGGRMLQDASPILSRRIACRLVTRSSRLACR